MTGDTLLVAGEASTTEASPYESAAAQRMFPKGEQVAPATAPGEVQALRDGDIARKLHPADKLYPADALRELALATNPGGTGADLKQQQTELANVAADLGFDTDDVRTLARLARTNAARPPTADEQQAHRRTALAELRRLHGDEGFDQAVKDAKTLTMRDPRFAAYLDRTGLANHPQVVLRMAELGRSERMRGRIK